MKIYLAIGDLSNFRIQLFQKLGVERVLVSYALLEGATKKLPFSDIMLDSGAYSAETINHKISLEAYTLWLQLYLKEYPQIKTYVVLDDLSSYLITKKNQEYMESESLSPLPVYHYGEPTEILNEMCSKYEYVGLGGMAVGRMPPENLKKFWEWVSQTYRDNKFHLFGVGTLTPFFNYQPYSLDSNSWTAGDRFMHIAGYKDKLPAWSHWGRNDTGWDFLFTHEELFSVNIRTMMDWEKLEWLKNVPKREEKQEWLL